jgi:hypothetical protein
MEYFMKILSWLSDLIKSYFNMKTEISKNERDKNKIDQEVSNKIDKYIESSHDAIESRDDDKLNEILK